MVYRYNKTRCYRHGFPTFGGTGDPLGDRGLGGTGGDPIRGAQTNALFDGATTECRTPVTTLVKVWTSFLKPNQRNGICHRPSSVVAKTRALKAEYTSELAQDLKAVHGLDAEVELANILSAEILAEINREVVRTDLQQR